MSLTLDQVNILHRSGRLEEAEAGYRALLAMENTTPELLLGLGVLLLQTKRASEAATHLQKAVDLKPNDAGLLNALGASQLQTGTLAEALKSFEKATSLEPEDVPALANLGVVRLRLNMAPEAVEAHERAAEIDPGNCDNLYNLSQALRASERFDGAEQVARRAIGCFEKMATGAPQYADAQHNLAQILLQTGRLDEGWAHFDWRMATSSFRGADVFRNSAEWNGEPLSDGTLLVWTEQGPGDEVLYASMIADLEGMAPHVVIACTQRLVALFERSFSFAHVVSHDDLLSGNADTGAISAQVAVGSLGQCVRSSFESFPNRKSFLVVDPAVAEQFRKRYREQSPERPVIGLSWRSGNPQYGGAKSLPLADLVRVLGQTDATFIDLQYGDTTSERAAAVSDGFHLDSDKEIDPLGDLDAFAAQVAAMDLVITVSNTTAHFAGALGVPCWALIPSGSGQFWYWFLDREDSPWYPSLRLFRQSVPGDWTSVLSDLHAALSEWQPRTTIATD